MDERAPADATPPRCAAARPDASIYRASDLLLVPNLLSLMRVPMAAAFPLVASSTLGAVALLAAAAASDEADGWYARRHGQTTPIGAVVDGLTDKLFMLSVVVTLVATGRLGLVGLAALAARDLGELLLLAYCVAAGRTRRSRATAPASNRAGKLATTTQFAAVVVVLARPAWADPVLAVAAVAGTAAAISYWRRELARTPA